MAAGVEMFRKRRGKAGEVIITDENKKIIDEVFTLYWAGRDYATVFHREVPEETRFMMYGPDPKKHARAHCRSAAEFDNAAFAELDAGLQQDPHTRRQRYPATTAIEAGDPLRAA